MVAIMAALVKGRQRECGTGKTLKKNQLLLPSLRLFNFFASCDGNYAKVGVFFNANC
jgi:hypothetical protein